MSADLAVVLADILAALEPRAWFAALEPAAKINVHGFTRCPLHADLTGTLQLGATPADGWWCWGCARGGDLPRYLALRAAPAVNAEHEPRPAPAPRAR